MAPPMRTAEERFVHKYEVADSGCWLWTASIRRNGYSQFRIDPKTNGYGHVFAYETYVGPIPEKHQLHHICGVKHCVNPGHLELVTPREHVLERDDTPAARNVAKTHCPRGHPYDDENTYVNPSTGRRTCRTCQKMWREEHQDELREYHREYVRLWAGNRYRNDPVFREKRKRASREYKRAQKAED